MKFKYFLHMGMFISLVELLVQNIYLLAKKYTIKLKKSY